MVSFRAFSLAASALLVAASGASAQANGTAYVTEVVTAYTTYCPGPTTIKNGNKTITVTSATTLTITDCPCTITRPVTPTGNKPSMPVYTAAAVMAVPTVPAGPLAAGLAGVLALVGAL